jgi:hypothetical protein
MARPQSVLLHQSAEKPGGCGEVASSRTESPKRHWLSLADDLNDR